MQDEEANGVEISTVSKLLAEWRGAEVDVTNVQLLEGGFVNKVCAVKFYPKHSKEIQEEIIIRMQDAEDVDEVLAEYYKEAWCIKKAAGAGIPTPEILFTGKCENVPYTVQKKNRCN